MPKSQLGGILYIFPPGPPTLIYCQCTFIYRVLDNRNKYMKDVRERKTQLNTIVIDIIN